jgi:hypothetical protein
MDRIFAMTPKFKIEAATVDGPHTNVLKRLPLLLIIFALHLSTALRLNGAIALAAQVDVVFAVVPRAELARAVIGRTEALAIEAEFFTQKRINNFSIVVFIQNNTNKAPIYGRLKVFLPGARDGREILVEAVPGYDSLYVIDYSGQMTMHVGNEKKIEWLELKLATG